MADGDGVGRPCRREVHPRSHFENLIRCKERSGGQTLRLECLGEEPPQFGEFRFVKGRRDLDVETVLRLDVPDIRGKMFPGEGKQIVPRRPGKPGTSVIMQKFHPGNRHDPGTMVFRMAQSVLPCFP